MNGYGGGEKEKSDINISYTLAFHARVFNLNLNLIASEMC
jgi:hypothetical protein